MRVARDIHGVFSVGTEVYSVPVIWMPSEGKQPKETQRTLCVSALEGKGGGYNV